MTGALRSAMALAARAWEKPAGVIAFKLWQHATIVTLTRTGSWRRMEEEANSRWMTADGDREAGVWEAGSLIDEIGIESVRRFYEANPDKKDETRALYDAVRRGEITIFGEPCSIADPDAIPWTTDWRFDHRWPSGDFYSYNFYEFDKEEPYDIKFPWELSRLNFLVAPTLLSLAEGHESWWKFLDKVLKSWQTANPMGNTVNWSPMECSMRGVNLSLLAQMAALGGDVARPALRRLLALCEIHGQFIFRTREYTDIRGNHYASNLAALTLLGLTVGRDGEAGRWLGFIQRAMDNEILLQFTEDGVQIEKSIPYHRLVTQLFLIAVISRRKAGLHVAPEAIERLKEAVRYAVAYTRPDGEAPAWGDNDDARALWFDTRTSADHRGMIALGAAFFNEPSFMPDDPSVEPALFLGEQQALSGDLKSTTQVDWFSEGGMVCARFGDGCHLVVDVGEVGLKGRGGHGHLDALSFELTLNHDRLIVDPGSYIYTGDPVERNRFRSTAAHNVPQVDGEEMAPLFSRRLWRLGSNADPVNVKVDKTGSRLSISAEHRGYERLDDPVTVRRAFECDLEKERLVIRDTISCVGRHRVTWRFHCAPGLDIVPVSKGFELIAPSGRRYLLRISGADRFFVSDDYVSEVYAKKMKSQTIGVTGDGELEFVCERSRGDA